MNAIGGKEEIATGGGQGAVRARILNNSRRKLRGKRKENGRKFVTQPFTTVINAVRARPSIRKNASRNAMIKRLFITSDSRAGRL